MRVRREGVTGASLVYRHADGDWVQEAVLESPGVEEGTGFGGTLALSDDLLVVGAVAADSLTGAAYVYERGSRWLGHDGGIESRQRWTRVAVRHRSAGRGRPHSGGGRPVRPGRHRHRLFPAGRRMDRNGDSPGL